MTLLSGRERAGPQQVWFSLDGVEEREPAAVILSEAKDLILDRAHEPEKLILIARSSRLVTRGSNPKP